MHWRTGRWVALPVALTVLASLLTGCGGVREHRAGADGPRLYVHGPTLLPSGGMDALVVGALTVSDGCVLLEEAGTRFPVVWPVGTSIAGTDPLVIELPSGELLHLGDRVSGGGGYLTRRHLDVDIPDECLDRSGEVAVFNADDDPVPISA